MKLYVRGVIAKLWLVVYRLLRVRREHMAPDSNSLYEQRCFQEYYDAQLMECGPIKRFFRHRMLRPFIYWAKGYLYCVGAKDNAIWVEPGDGSSPVDMDIFVLPLIGQIHLTTGMAVDLLSIQFNKLFGKYYLVLETGADASTKPIYWGKEVYA